MTTSQSHSVPDTMTLTIPVPPRDTSPPSSVEALSPRSIIEADVCPSRPLLSLFPRNTSVPSPLQLTATVFCSPIPRMVLRAVERTSSPLSAIAIDPAHLATGAPSPSTKVSLTLSSRMAGRTTDIRPAVRTALRRNSYSNAHNPLAYMFPNDQVLRSRSSPPFIPGWPLPLNLID